MLCFRIIKIKKERIGMLQLWKSWTAGKRKPTVPMPFGRSEGRSGLPKKWM
ncbi:hypothetical protein GT23_2158 [Parageobacillus thermoglucosidasius]|nr:hypothetical protein GT23_2158 [Parageobacillus thermoglucosidasius]